MTYQKVTGALMANSHPGSYCGQDAYNDMLITDELLHRERTNQSIISPGESRCVELHGRSTEDTNRGGGTA